MTHMTPAQHYNRAQELLDAVQSIQNTMTGPMAVNAAPYVDAVNSMLVLSTAATAHAALASVNPNVAANALALTRSQQGTPAAKSEPVEEETETLRLMARLHTVLDGTDDVDLPAVTRALDMLNSTVPSERTRGREAAREVLNAAMRDRANNERESAGLPREDEDARRRAYVDRQKDPHQPKTDQYIRRLEAMVAEVGHYGQKEQEAMRLLKSDDMVERGRGRTAAALLLGDLR